MQPLVFFSIAIGVILLLVLFILLLKQNKPEAFQKNNMRTSSAMGRGMGAGIAIGMGAGVALGVAADNIALGIALGAGIGISMGVAIGQSLQKKEESNHLRRNASNEKTRDSNIRAVRTISLVFILSCLLAMGILLFINLK